MKLLVLDVETNLIDNASPFSQQGKLVCVGYWDGTSGDVIRPTPIDLALLQKRIDAADLIGGWNFKFDYHWLRRYGINLKEKKIWDGMLSHYIQSRQIDAFFSLNDAASARYDENKLDVVKTEYWDNGIETDLIPWDVLSEYCLKDCVLTHKIISDQLNEVPDHQRTLFSLAMQDLHVLEEMEWNGLRFNREGVEKALQEAQAQVAEILDQLKVYNVPEGFNWGSPEQLSALLYGGTISLKTKVPNGVWKTGAKAGQVKFSNVVTEYTLKRKYKPIKGTEMAKPGVWSTDEATLTKLGKEGLIGKVLEIRAIEKQISTYYQKLPAMQDEHSWDKNYIHGQFSQTTTATGRLASSKPNLQNISESANRLFISRYNTTRSE